MCIRDRFYVIFWWLRPTGFFAQICIFVSAWKKVRNMHFIRPCSHVDLAMAPYYLGEQKPKFFIMHCNLRVVLAVLPIWLWPFIILVIISFCFNSVILWRVNGFCFLKWEVFKACWALYLITVVWGWGSWWQILGFSTFPCGMMKIYRLSARWTCCLLYTSRCV